MFYGIVRMQSASGQTRDIRVQAVRSADRAIRTAQKYLDKVAPNEGWRPVYALEN